MAVNPKVWKWSERLLVASAAALVIGPFIATVWYYRAIAPLPRASIKAVAAQVVFEKLCRVERDGKVFYVARGQMPLYTLASGPPVYVFDDEGKLADWMQDDGEEPTKADKWESLPSRDVSLEEVLQNIKGQDGR